MVGRLFGPEGNDYAYANDSEHSTGGWRATLVDLGGTAATSY